jgi:glycerol kinase
MIFDHDGRVVAADGREHEQIYPQPGWVEHDPEEIWQRTGEVIAGGLAAAGLAAGDLAAVGITNQRETTIVWERGTGRAVTNAIVWQDARTDRIVDALSADGGPDRFRRQTGLPVSTYFSATKIRWILENVEGTRERAERGELLFGTLDSYLVWRLTGGAEGGIHITDPTNASRTLLMDLRTLDWDDGLCDAIGVPRTMLPEIRSSSEVYAEAGPGPLEGVAVAGILGDQQAAMFGQTCFDAGDAKNTYGTGNFLLVNTGSELLTTENLLTTVAYKVGDAPPVYALEGSIHSTGAAVQWLRDNLGLIGDASEIEALAASVPDTAGICFVPAFAGLFAPYWRDDARGAIVGITRSTTRAHLARAALEATAWQSKEVVDAVDAVSDVPLTDLRVDGGMVVNELLMQFQADVLGAPVVRPVVPETTSLGAAYAAGLAVGFWRDLEDLRRNWSEDRRWSPRMEETDRDARYRQWKKAVTRTFDWIE